MDHVGTTEILKNSIFHFHGLTMPLVIVLFSLKCFICYTLDRWTQLSKRKKDKP